VNSGIGPPSAEFLPSHERVIQWNIASGVPEGLHPKIVLLGKGANALEIAIAEANRKPKAEDVRRLWRLRYANRASPVLLVVIYDKTKAAICGPLRENSAVLLDQDLGYIERLSDSALGEPNRHAAVRLLMATFETLELDQIPGLHNVGLLSTQELRAGVPHRADWERACREGESLLSLSGTSLVNALGFEVEKLTVNSSILSVRGAKRAVAIFLDDTEAFESPAERFRNASPASQGLALADRENLPWVVLNRNQQLRIYAAKPDVGVGYQGRAETYTEINLALLPADSAGYLMLLFGASALVENGTLEQLLDSSADFAADLSKRLRERVYFQVVPTLARAVLSQRTRRASPTNLELETAYEESLVILFRLLFVAYAEDRNLLPYRTNDRYTHYALKTLARDLTERQKKGPLSFDSRATDLWDGISDIWRAIDKGNTDWGVPAYNGGLFSSDDAVGAALGRMSLTNAEFGPALAFLLVDVGEDSVTGPVDFRNLSVREFGTIYEGLLESSLSVAPFDLTVDDRSNFVAAGKGDVIEVRKGDVYFHNRAGERKATGTYFTKPFAVAHLLDAALEPTLSGHLARLQSLADANDVAALSDAFFDFRCVDLAMGSGHFLVAAVDRIEARLSTFLATHPINAINAELSLLRAAALNALGDLGEGIEIEQSSLLRRQVARRCVYGVDLNGTSVELSRLAMWIHTFVPGLPLSFLDHNLIVGNSLVGIATLDEALEILDPGAESDTKSISLFRNMLEEFLSRATAPLHRLARAAETTSADIVAARQAQSDARVAVEPAKDLFDLLMAGRMGEVDLPAAVTEETIAKAKGLKRAKAIATEFSAIHFPVAFPEVFLRKGDSGFDCVLGNPPWDKVKFEQQHFWVTRSPGLNALNSPKRDAMIAQLRKARPADAEIEEHEQQARERFQQYVHASYSHLGRGHYDFAKLFLERALSLLRLDGYLGYVLPRPALVLGGWGPLRRLLFRGCHALTVQARNSRRWLFDDIDERITVTLVSRTMANSRKPPGVEIVPDVFNPEELKPKADRIINLTDAELSQLSDSYVVPWFNSPRDVTIFNAMRLRPKLSSGSGWIAATNDSHWDFSGTGPHRDLATSREASGYWKVLMATHVERFAIRRDLRFQSFVRNPIRLVDTSYGVVSLHRRVVVGPNHPAIVFRYPSRQDDSRTMIAAILPEEGEIYSKGYVHGVRHAVGTPPAKILALLGYLNTFVCDWWVRRFVDRHVTAPVVHNIPLPSWDDDAIERVAELTTQLCSENMSGFAAGHISIAPVRALPASSREELRVKIEFEALQGFGLQTEDLETILSDFAETNAGCSRQMRQMLLGTTVP
jgi:hypothetical protein